MTTTCPACEGHRVSETWSELLGRDVELPCPCCDDAGAPVTASCVRESCTCVADALHEYERAGRDYREAASW